MDVVGVYVLVRHQHRVATLQALQRQAVGGVDAGRAQQGDAHPATPAEIAQAALGIDPAPAARGLRVAGPGFIHMGSATVAVNPCRAYVYQALW